MRARDRHQDLKSFNCSRWGEQAPREQPSEGVDVRVIVACIFVAAIAVGFALRHITR